MKTLLIFCSLLFCLSLSYGQSPQTSQAFDTQTLNDADTAYFTYPFTLPDSKTFSSAYAVDQSWIISTTTEGDTAALAGYLEVSNDGTVWAPTGDTIAIVGETSVQFDIANINAKNIRIRVSQTTDPDTTVVDASVRTLIHLN
jgi:hypothetical protein